MTWLVTWLKRATVLIAEWISSTPRLLCATMRSGLGFVAGRSNGPTSSALTPMLVSVPCTASRPSASVAST